MAIPQLIQDLANKVRAAKFGIEVRESIAKSMEETGKTADEARQAADELIQRVNNLLQNSQQASEVVDARNEPDGTEHDLLRDHLFAIHQKIENLQGVEVSIKTFPKLETDVNDTERFQRAFAFVSALGGGKVTFPTGVYVANVKIPLNCGLEGTGRNSVLKCPANSDAGVIELADGNVRNIYLHNFSIDGNKANQTSANAKGVYISGNSPLPASTNPVETGDPRHFIQDIFITNTKGIGFHIKGRGGHQITGVQVRASDNHGFYIETYDTTFQNCDSGSNAKSAFYVKNNNNRFVSCKGWNSAQYAGFDITDSFGFYFDNVQGIVMSACEAQSNYHHGVYLNNCKDMLLVGVNSEDNGAGISGEGLSIDSCGFALNDCKNITIIGGTRNVNSDFQDYAVGLYGDSDNNNIILSSYLMTLGALDNPEGRTSNNIQIFGDKEAKESNFDFLAIGANINRALTKFQVTSKRGEQITGGIVGRNFLTDWSELEVFRLQAAGQAGDGTTTYQQVAFYHDMNTGQTRVTAPSKLFFDVETKLGSGTWNGKHVEMGNYHLWFNSSGGLVFKNGVPTSDNDGSPIAFQRQSANNPPVGNGGTISTNGVSMARVSPTSNTTGGILQAGVYGGQEVAVINEGSGSITFAASGSNVADGAADVINAGTARKFVWNTATSLWYRIQ